MMVGENCHLPLSKNLPLGNLLSLLLLLLSFEKYLCNISNHFLNKNYHYVIFLVVFVDSWIALDSAPHKS